MDSRSRRMKGAARGFTLLEVLIAFTILALSLAVVMQAFSTGFRSLERAEDSAIVTLQARSKLAELGQTIPLEPSEQGGELDDGATWRMVIEPAAVEGESGDFEGFGILALYRVEITVTKEKSASITLVTLRSAESLDL